MFRLQSPKEIFKIYLKVLLSPIIIISYIITLSIIFYFIYIGYINAILSLIFLILSIITIILLWIFMDRDSFIYRYCLKINSERYTQKDIELLFETIDLTKYKICDNYPEKIIYIYFCNDTDLAAAKLGLVRHPDDEIK